MEAVITYFTQQGVLGIVIVMMMAVIAWQQKRIDAKDKQISELQDRRIEDTNGYTASYTQTTREMVATTKDSINALNLLQRSIDSLATAVQSWINGKGK